MKVINAKDKKVLKVGVIVLVLLAVCLGFWWGNRHLDGRRFAEADRKAHAVLTSLVQSIGAPIHSESSKVCFNTEHGPWDDGRLWCQVAAVAFFALETPPTSIDNAFTQVVEANNLQLVDKRAASLEFLGSDNLPCEVEFNTSESAKHPAYYLPSNQDAKQVLVVRCSDRAKAQHYPRAD